MNKYIEKNFSKLISIFIILGPILDLLTGICLHKFNLSITIGIVIRIIFLAFIMYTTTFIYKKKNSFLAYLAIFIYSCLYILGTIIYKDGVLLREVQSLVKVFYFPIILISLYDLKDEFRISNMTLFTSLFLYLILILVPNALNIGYKSYEITKSGTLGFFNSANEISGIIAILTPIMFIILKDLKSMILKAIYLIIYLVVILTIGTKTPLLTLLITVAFSYLYYMITCIKKKTYKPILYSAFLILVAFCSLLLVLPKTNFYKNIKVHLDYLEVDNVFDIFKEKRLVDHFIFSERLTFLEKKATNYADSTLYEHLFGIGYTKDKKTTKLIEMDYFDILYSHGVVGFIIIFTIYGLVIYDISKNTKKTKSSYDRYMLKLSFALILILSMLTGHIITAPAVSLIVVILIVNLSTRKKRDLLFTAVDFNMGGIETALINLLNNIDYTKYNVTVVLENKKGILLSEVNPNATLKSMEISTNKNVIIRKLTNFSKRLIFTILNYHNFDFGCCYATYSLSGNKIARLSSKNTAIYIHSNYLLIYKDEKDFRDFFDKRNIKEFRKIIFVSNESRTGFLTIYPDLKEKSTVINNFVDIDKILKNSQIKIDATKPKNKKLFVYVGRLDDSCKKVTKALNLVRNIKDIELWIIGDGPDRKLYEDYMHQNKLENRVTFFGQKLNPYPYMEKADYIILTSDYEGFPVTYIEAIALNKPIITTIDVSDDEINIGKDYAYIISKDEEAMVKQVEKILKKKPSFKQLDFKEVQKKRRKKLEKIFNEVV